MIPSENDTELVQAALTALGNSYSPYSRFRVGAALRSETGRIFAAGNVENASYGLTVCAERAAIFKMVSEGFMKIASLAVVNESGKDIVPCGACLQVIREFAGDDCRIICSSGSRVRIFVLSELLPESFKPSDLI